MSDNIRDVAKRLLALTYTEMKELAQGLADTLEVRWGDPVDTDDLADALSVWAEHRLDMEEDA